VGTGVAPVGTPDLRGDQGSSFWGSLWNGVVSTKTSVVAAKMNTIAAFQEKIQPGGDWYKGWQWTKTGGKLVAGCVAMFGGPLGIIIGANMVFSASWDIGHLILGQYDSVGEFDLMRNMLKESFGDVGRWLGYEQQGEMVGDSLYFFVQLLGLGSGVYKLGDTVINIGSGKPFTGFMAAQAFYDAYDGAYGGAETSVDLYKFVSGAFGL
jgi:hypothetical protein